MTNNPTSRKASLNEAKAPTSSATEGGKRVKETPILLGAHKSKKATAVASPRAATLKKPPTSTISPKASNTLQAAVPDSGAEPAGRTKPPKPPYPPRIAKGAEMIELANGQKITIAGIRDEGGCRYVLFASADKRAMVLYADFHGGGSRASSALRDQGFIIVSDFGAVRQAASKLKHFPAVPIVTQPGWSRYGFTQSNLKLIRAPDTPAPLKALKPTTGLLDAGGALPGWITDVAERLADHTIPSFCMMMMFAAAVLRLTNRSDNFGFELVGEAGKGKSTLQLAISTAAGPAVGDGDTTYWRSLNSTVNALEDTLQAYQDMPLILDEAALLSGSGRTESRALVMRDLAFRLSDGRPRQRFRDPAGPRARLIYLMSSNRSIYSLLGTSHAAETTAIADRLITLPVLSTRPYGVFDHCPDGYSSTGAFADALRVAASQHYGQAMPVYLAFLVERKHKAPEELRQRINAHISEFVHKSGADQNDGSQLRVAEAFGLVYASGRLAKMAKVLPSSYRCLRTALAAYELHRDYGRVPVSFADRLQALVRHPDTIDLGEVSVNELTAAQLKGCSVFLYRGRTGARELLIPAAYIDRVFPGWNGMRHDAEVVEHAKRSTDRLTVDRPIGVKGSQQPVYCFDISAFTS